MDSKPQKETLYESCVYRIPALLYEREKETLLAFAEQRRTEDDSNAKNLVMKTGRVKKDKISDVRTIEVIMPNDCFISELLVNI